MLFWLYQPHVEGDTLRKRPQLLPMGKITATLANMKCDYLVIADIGEGGIFRLFYSHALRAHMCP